jgi:hypothetical protein
VNRQEALAQSGQQARRRGSEKVTIEVPLLRWLAVRLSRVSATFNVTPEKLVAVGVGRLLALGDEELFQLLRHNDDKGD